MNFSESIYAIEVICTLVGMVIGSIATYFSMKNRKIREEVIAIKELEKDFPEATKKRKRRVEKKKEAEENLEKIESEAQEMVKVGEEIKNIEIEKEVSNG
jgi:uncharacterized protein (DUF3084 family)